MANIISFQDNEIIHFRHKATHNNEQGELVITNLRVCFSFSNSQIASVQLPWQSIDKTKYTPLNDPKGRVMLMIQTVQKGNPVIFQFVGELEACQKELERLKEIISKIRSSSATPTNAVSQTSNNNLNTSSTNQSSSTSTDSTPKVIKSIANSTSSVNVSSAILESRKKLLEADKTLASKYRDLVLGDKILTEEEFWNSQDSFNSNSNRQNAHINHSLTFPDPTVRGKSTALFADVKKTYKNGKLTVNLTTETKESIFLLYPAVKYAYQEEVPLYKTEQEFWISYFQSEYYNRDKGGTSEAGNMLINRSRIDEIINQYEHQKKNLNANSSLVTSSSSSSSTARSSEHNSIVQNKNIMIPNSHNQHNKGIFASSIDSSIDLTSTYGDYRPSEVMSQLLSYEDRELTTDKDIAQGRHAVIEKYNKHSSVLMQNVPAGRIQNSTQTSPNKNNDIEQSKTSYIHKNSNNMEFEELIEIEDNDNKLLSKYLPLQLVNHHDHTYNHLKTKLNDTNNSASHSHDAIDESQESAFGVSTFRKVAKTSSMLHLPHSIDNQTVSGQEEIQKIKGSIHQIWPAADRAYMTNQNLIMPALREAWQLQHEVGKQFQPQSNIYGTNSTTDVSDTLSKHSNSSSRDSISHVSDVVSSQQDHLFRSNQTAFLMEMREKYCTISELLRHFFAMLSSLSTGSANDTLSLRIEKLIQRLNQNKDNLKRKAEHVDTTVTNRYEKLSCRAIIEDMMKLLDRAELKWKDYQMAILSNSGIK